MITMSSDKTPVRMRLGQGVPTYKRCVCMLFLTAGMLAVSLGLYFPSQWTQILKSVTVFSTNKTWMDTSFLLTNNTARWIHTSAAPWTNQTRWVDLPTTPSQWVDPGPFHVAYPRNYRFDMDEPERCQEEKPFLVLMVPVAPQNREARDAIRRTWGNETLVQGKRIVTFFLLGLPGGEEAQTVQEEVRLESKEHHDLLQSNFQDTYHNLTIKTMVMLEWLASRCSNASYVMKVDSDMFLNVDKLMSILLEPDTPRHNYMTGYVWAHSPVIRNPFNKFFLPQNVFPDDEYPPYPLGLGYILSLDLPRKILRVSPQIKPIYIEDAYLGMCMRLLGISPTYPPSPDLFVVVPTFGYSRCRYASLVAVTSEGPSQLLANWADFKKGGPPC